MEGNGKRRRPAGDVERQVVERLTHTVGQLPPPEQVVERGLDDDSVAQILAAQLAQLTALQEVVALLAAEIDALKQR